MQILLFLTILLARSWALLQILTPESGTIIDVSGSSVTIPITWDDDTSLPTLDDIELLTFALCTGPNNDVKCLGYVYNISSSDVNGSYNATFKSDLAADGVFMVQIYAALIDDDGYVIEYTPRVQLSGMSGSYEPSGNGAVPDAQVDSNDEALISKSFTVPYTEQTGLTRYAPMQMQPESTVTATTWSRRFPTSAVTYYKSQSGQPNVSSTVTPGWSYTMSSLINMATPAAFPSEVGWYAASEKLVSATLEGGHKRLKRKRWED